MLRLSQWVGWLGLKINKRRLRVKITSVGIDSKLNGTTQHNLLAGTMDKETIEQILDKYGLEQILKDNGLPKYEMLSVLEEIGYINLSMYVDDVDL